MGRSRNTLHKTKINDFKEWLESSGWSSEKPKGHYEVLRMRHKEHGIVLIYDRNDAIEHYTTFGIGYSLVRKWLRDRKQ